MEAIILIGIQGAGKTTFYKTHFFETHLRLSRDQLRTPHRLHSLRATCFATKTPFVWENTNASRAERAETIALARAAGFTVKGYYLRSNYQECLERNNAREGKARIPVGGVLGTLARLQRPTLEEGFDSLCYVSIDEAGRFIIEPWNEDKDEV